MDRSRTLCLNMIVRNEAAIIIRALESVADHIGYWVICDTGSNDGTEAIIERFFAARGIPGELHRFDFVNFAVARNRALDAARQSGGSFDYLLLMDADMQLRLDSDTALEGLDASSYALQQRSSALTYWNTRIVRRDVPSQYRGVTHEYLEVPTGQQMLAGAWFIDEADGGNRPGKFERDIALLQAGLAEEPDSTRYVFYLAQSYRDAGQLEKAAETYRRRATMGGWAEEAWNARLNEARCLLRLGDEAGFQAAAAAAFTERPHRAEPLHDLALFCRQRGQYEAAMGLAELATHIPWPEKDRLFIEDFVYRYGIREELSVSGFYCAAEARKQAGRFACNSLALDPGAPVATRTKARSNLVYYARQAVELLPSFAPRQLSLAAWPGASASAPSIVARPEGFAVIVRLAGALATSGHLLVALDDGLAVHSAAEIVPPAGIAPPDGLRPFRWHQQEWCVGVVGKADTGDAPQALVARLAAAPGAPAVLADVRIVRADAPASGDSWMPLLRDDTLAFVVSCDPARVVDERGAVLAEARPPAALDHLGGASQLVPFDGGWVALTRETPAETGAARSLHRFVWFDAGCVPARVTEPFRFGAGPFEAAAGLAWHGDGQRLVLSYGVDGNQAWLATVDAADVRAALRSRAEATAAAASDH